MNKEILNQFKIEEVKNVIRIKNKEDGSFYNVWYVETINNKYIIKEAKQYESFIYSNLLKHIEKAVPKLYGVASYQNKEYLLIEYLEGEDLCKCKKESLIKVLDAVIYLQDKYWNNDELKDLGYTFEKSLESRVNRGKYLNDSLIEKYYNEFLNIYSKVPRTLCHDDLLPFNVIVNKVAYLIDWEYGGILPYPIPIVRLLAHGTNNLDDLFYMNDEDKKFAFEYYYHNFIKYKNISYEEYIKTINYFLIYEYCEWIMIGNKYNNTETERFKYYYNKCVIYINETFK